MKFNHWSHHGYTLIRQTNFYQQLIHRINQIMLSHHQVALKAVDCSGNF